VRQKKKQLCKWFCVLCIEPPDVFKHLNFKKNIWLTHKIPEETMQILDGGPEDVRLQPSELIADPIAFPRLLFFNFTSFKYFLQLCESDISLLIQKYFTDINYEIITVRFLHFLKQLYPIDDT
jgi:hypothetical protein